MIEWLNRSLYSEVDVSILKHSLMKGIHKPLFEYSTQERFMSNLIELGHVVLKKTIFNKYLYFPYFSWENLGYYDDKIKKRRAYKRKRVS